MTPQNILLDVDGILADFFGAALVAHGRADLVTRWPKGEWDMAKVMGITEEAFWAPLDNYAFWVSVPMYTGADEFVADLERIAPVTFCTSPSMSPESYMAKVAWLRDNIGAKTNIMLGGRKWLMAKPGNVLIDDYERNVEKFRAAGGPAVLFPRPWNRGICAGDEYEFAVDCVRCGLDGEPHAPNVEAVLAKGDD